jgi:acetyl-CoA carboxylase beta subunit
MTDAELINAIEAQRALMIAVATGGPRIQEVNAQYIQRRSEIADELQRRGLEDPNPHGDLWA